MPRKETSRNNFFEINSGFENKNFVVLRYFGKI